jgi:hypothetical protein
MKCPWCDGPLEAGFWCRTPDCAIYTVSTAYTISAYADASGARKEVKFHTHADGHLPCGPKVPERRCKKCREVFWSRNGGTICWQCCCQGLVAEFCRRTGAIP